MICMHWLSFDLRCESGTYVIYKPWLQGVLHLYTPQLRSQRKFTVDKCRGEAEVFINSKLPMTEEEGCIYVQYTEVSHGSYDIIIPCF